MAYDSTRDRTVLFGGLDSDRNRLGDTWEWDGTTWAQVATTGFETHFGQTMAYDSARQRTVLVGVGSSFECEVWEWDGTVWTRATTSGPVPAQRTNQAMAYDSARQRTLLFGGGGIEHEDYGDTWAWDGTAWTLSESIGPPPRTHHAMIYDSARNRIVLFSGHRDRIYPEILFRDTWEFVSDPPDPTPTPTSAPTSAPSPTSTPTSTPTPSPTPTPIVEPTVCPTPSPTPTPTPTLTPTTPSPTLDDVTVLILGGETELPPSILDALDPNDDGALDVADILWMRNP